MDSFHARMVKARGDVGREKAAQRALAYLPEDMSIDSNMVRRLEGAGDRPIREENADPFIVRALAISYGVPVGELSAIALEQLERRRDLLLDQIGWLGVFADQRAEPARHVQMALV